MKRLMRMVCAVSMALALMHGSNAHAMGALRKVAMKTTRQGLKMAGVFGKAGKSIARAGSVLSRAVSKMGRAAKFASKTKAASKFKVGSTLPKKSSKISSRFKGIGDKLQKAEMIFMGVGMLGTVAWVPKLEELRGYNQEALAEQAGSCEDLGLELDEALGMCHDTESGLYYDLEHDGRWFDLKSCMYVEGEEWVTPEQLKLPRPAACAEREAASAATCQDLGMATDATVGMCRDAESGLYYDLAHERWFDLKSCMYVKGEEWVTPEQLKLPRPAACQKVVEEKVAVADLATTCQQQGLTADDALGMCYDAGSSLHFDPAHERWFNKPSCQYYDDEREIEPWVDPDVLGLLRPAACAPTVVEEEPVVELATTCQQQGMTLDDALGMCYHAGSALHFDPAHERWFDKPSCMYHDDMLGWTDPEQLNIPSPAVCLKEVEVVPAVIEEVEVTDLATTCQQQGMTADNALGMCYHAGSALHFDPARERWFDEPSCTYHDDALGWVDPEILKLPRPAVCSAKVVAGQETIVVEQPALTTQPTLTMQPVAQPAVTTQPVTTTTEPAAGGFTSLLQQRASSWY